MAEKIRIGIIGNGGICKGAHIPTYLEDDRVEIVGVCDIIEERAQFIKDEYFPEAKVYTDYKEEAGKIQAETKQTMFFYFGKIFLFS